MEFNPSNPVVQLCIQGMGMEEKGQPEEAGRLFMQAWDAAGDDFGKFTAAYHVARLQKNVSDRLKWHETALQLALSINNDAVKGAFAGLYKKIAQCYEDLGDPVNAKRNDELAVSAVHMPSDKGRFIMGREQICRLAIC